MCVNMEHTHMHAWTVGTKDGGHVRDTNWVCVCGDERSLQWG